MGGADAYIAGVIAGAIVVGQLAAKLLDAMVNRYTGEKGSACRAEQVSLEAMAEYRQTERETRDAWRSISIDLQEVVRYIRSRQSLL